MNETKEEATTLSIKASAIIYSRMKHVGFPQGLMIQPEDFTPEEAERMMRYIHDAMRNDIELRSAHLCSRMIIADDRHVIMGVVCFLRDLVNGAWSTTDSGHREIHGFLGYAWHREDFPSGAGFPLNASLLAALEKWVHPHWEDSDHALWAEFPHLSAYEDAVEAGVLSDEPATMPSIDTPEEKTAWIFSPETEADAVIWAIEQIGQGKNLSLCTNLYLYSNRDRETLFQYAVQMNDFVVETPSPSVPFPSQPAAPVAEACDDKNVGVKLPRIGSKSLQSNSILGSELEKTKCSSRQKASEQNTIIILIAGICGIVLLTLAIILYIKKVLNGLWLVAIILPIAAIAVLFGTSAKKGLRKSRKLEKQSYISMPSINSVPKPKGTDLPKEASEHPTKRSGQQKETTEDIFRM